MAEFSQKFQNFSSSFSESNLKNQSGRFSALQEEKPEQQRSDILSNKHVKSTKIWLNVLDEWRGQRREARRLEDISSCGLVRFGCPRNFSIQLFPNWTACSPITYTKFTVIQINMNYGR